jgi:hypothetical protein
VKRLSDLIWSAVFWVYGKRTERKKMTAREWLDYEAKVRRARRGRG